MTKPYFKQKKVTCYMSNITCNCTSLRMKMSWSGSVYSAAPGLLPAPGQQVYSQAPTGNISHPG